MLFAQSIKGSVDLIEQPCNTVLELLDDDIELADIAKEHAD
jgi:hypothetical protein